MSQVCVIGMGYVGLTLAAAFAKKGHNVIGIERSKELVAKINSSQVPFVDQGLEETLQKVLKESKLTITSTLDEVSASFDFVIIAIGTPISEKLHTDISNFSDIPSQLEGHISPNCVVILRSTIPVGTTRKLGEMFRSEGLNVDVSFCPERTVEGIALNELFVLPQIVSGENARSLENVTELFLSITPDIVPVANLETAELVKLCSNMWRDYTFAFSNELFRLTQNFTIDVHELIDAANHNYLRNQIPKPGGVGGPCLTKDTYIFNQSIGNMENIFTHAREVNAGFPKEVARVLGQGDLVTGNVGICGWAFKGNPPTSDIRFTPTLEIFKEVTSFSQTKKFYGWDPEPINVSELPDNLEYIANFADLLPICDTLIIANNHPFFSSQIFAEMIEESKKPLTLIDLWNVVPDLRNITNRVVTLGEL
jgi:UDP-N-acetyl-D-mannosaminuronic acid dehydrogenase